MIKQVIINNFDGGLEDDVRSSSRNGYACASHFDYSLPHKLVPARDLEAEGNISGNAIQNYEITDVLYHTYSTGANLFALGINYNTNTYPAILEKSGDVITSSFALSNNGAASTGIAVPNTLFEYQQNLYYVRTAGGATYLTKYARATTTLSQTFATFSSTSTPTAKPFHHKKSDIVYIPFANVLSQLSGSSVTDILTLPTTETITALAEYGSYLAIGVSPAGNQSTRCKLYIYDMVSADVTDVITIGEGTIKLMDNMNGVVVFGVLQYNSFSVRGGNTIKFYGYTGGQGVSLLKDFTGNTGSFNNTLYQFIGRRADTLYFATYDVPVNGSARSQLWAMKRNRFGKYVVEGFVVPDNSAGTISGIRGFYVIGDNTWVSYNSGGTTHYLKRTNDQISYTATSIYESQKFGADDSSSTKKLLGVTIMTEPLPTDQPTGSTGQVVLKYRKDEETSWTTIFTHSVANSISHSAVNIESSGTNFPDFKEVQFRVELKNGAILTGLKFKYETIDKDIY